MKIGILLMFLLTIILIKSQVIELKEFYSGEGVIFDNETQYPFKEKNFKKSITPDIQNIKEAEKLLSRGYYQYRTNILDSFGAPKSLLNVELKKPKNVIKRFEKYNRQYFGYTTKSNDTILTIVLLNFKNKRKAKKYFPNWKKEIQVGFHGFYEDNLEWYSLNLTTGNFIYKIEN